MEPDSDLRVRDVHVADVELYLQTRSDPVMTKDLGGPIDEESVRRSLLREVDATRERRALSAIIEIQSAAGWTPVGNITLTPSGEDGSTEIGWMVLPRYQGRGLARRGVRALLETPRSAERWGTIHAYPAISNTASNRIAFDLGFKHVADTTIEFNRSTFRVAHWLLRPPYDLTER